MNRTLLRLLNPLAFVLLVTLGIAFQTAFFLSEPLNYLQPDIVLAAVIWASLRRNFTEGGILTLLFANLAEIHSSSPQGLFLCSYMIIFLSLRAASRLLILPRLSSLILGTFTASLTWKLSQLAILNLLGLSSNQWKHTFLFALPSALATALFAAWMYRALERFDWVTFKNPQARQLSEDELTLEGEGI